MGPNGVGPSGMSMYTEASDYGVASSGGQGFGSGMPSSSASASDMSMSMPSAVSAPAPAMHTPVRSAGQGRAGQGRAGQGRARQGRVVGFEGCGKPVHTFLIGRNCCLSASFATRVHTRCTRCVRADPLDRNPVPYPRVFSQLVAKEGHSQQSAVEINGKGAV